MSFKETMELRKARKLDEALKMANQVLEAEPENIWNKRAAAWVYYDYLKKYSQPDSFDVFKENLIKIKDLQLPEDEKMVFDNSAWQIGSMAFGLQKQENIDYGKINELLEVVKEFHFTKPSEQYSFIYKAFHKGHQNWSKYLEFADWWNFENFRPEDYLKEEFKDKKIMAIAEQAYIAYSKKLLEGEPVDPFRQERAIDKNKIRTFLPQLDKIIDERPEYQYPPYFKAKLLLTLGDHENILSSFLPFAKQKRNDFWVWELMAEIFPDDEDKRFACYCKALTLNTPEDYLVNIRLRFVGMLLKRQMHAEAKTEIQKVIATREKNKWKIPNKIQYWLTEEWYRTAIPKQSNKRLYVKNSEKATAILFENIPEEVIVVEFVNEYKMQLNFVKNQGKYGVFNYSNCLKMPRIGDILKVRFTDNGKDGFHHILSAKKVSSEEKTEALKDFEGELKIIPPNNFGFANGVYINASTIKSLKLKHGEKISGKAILSYNKKKKVWGWKSTRDFIEKSFDVCE